MKDGNVLLPMPLPSRNELRGALAQVMRGVQARHALTDEALADLIGVSVGTIANVRNERTDLNQESIARLADMLPDLKTVSAKPKGERGQGASRPRVVRHEPAQPAPHILDCPVGSPFAAMPVTGFDLPARPSPFGAVGWASVQPGGVWLAPTRPTPPSFPSAIPEPDAWAMLVAGFGMVGLSLRNRKATA